MNYIQGNSNVSHTYHIYLDSDSATKAGNIYQFDISPTVEVQFPERGEMYLKEFSGINNLYNINQSNTSNSVKLNGAPALGTGTIPIGNYATLDELKEALNTAFSNITFTVEEGLKIKATAPNPGDALEFSGNLFKKILRFTVNEVVVGSETSAGEVDLHRSTHNVYMSVAEVANNTRDVGTAANKGSRIAKIPIATQFGAYVVYQAQEPVQKSPVENSMINQLNIQLFDDDGVAYIPDRFTITLALEIVVPVQTDYKNQLTDMPGPYSTSKMQPVLGTRHHQVC